MLRYVFCGTEVLEVELSDEEWLVKLDGKPQPEMSYVRQGDYGV